MNKLKETRLKWYIEESFFGKTEMDDLVLWVTCKGVRNTD